MTILSLYFVSLHTYTQTLSSADGLNWWRTISALGELPILRVVAAKRLCIPASSAKVERVFSQSGFIDSALRNRLGALTLEMLTLLKVEWDDVLYKMTHAEKMDILREFKKRAIEAGLPDPTDRLYGIEEEETELTVEPMEGIVELMEGIETEDFGFIDEPEEEDEQIDLTRQENLDEILSVSGSEYSNLSSDADSDEELQ